MKNMIIKMKKFLGKKKNKMVLFTWNKNYNEKRYNLVDVKDDMISIDFIAEINKNVSQIESKVKAATGIVNKDVFSNLCETLYVCNVLVDFAKRYKEMQDDCKNYQNQLEAYEFEIFSLNEKIKDLEKEKS